MEKMNETMDLEEKEKNKGKRSWYVVHTYSGHENKVKANIARRVESMGMEDKIFEVLIPVEKKIEYKDGKRKMTEKRVFPGYVIVEMELDDDSWYTVRNTPGVTGFVGSGKRPIPLRDEEILEILRQMGIDDAKPKIDLSVGDGVKVRSGPFQDFPGVVENIDEDRGKLKVLVDIFGRETPVELDFSQITKL